MDKPNPMTTKTGDSENFNVNWVNRAETAYNHWTAGEPKNQIQLAFRSHWHLFKELMGDRISGGKSLEVGCGRASISSYFAQNGFEITALDLSEAVIQQAKKIFSINGHTGTFVVGDALNLPFANESFNVITSIGLLEHFEDIDRLLSEQIRVLKPGGLFLGYVVPENKNNVQKDYNWINDIIRLYADLSTPHQKKAEIYRSDFGSDIYVPVLKKYGLKNVMASGVYPLPMISPNIDFPFTLMPEPMEQVLVRHFQSELKERALSTGQNPWLCDETYGQAFLLWGWK